VTLLTANLLRHYQSSRKVSFSVHCDGPLRSLKTRGHKLCRNMKDRVLENNLKLARK